MKREDFFRKIEKDQALDSSEINPGPFVVRNMERKGIDPEASREAKEKASSLDKLTSEMEMLVRTIDSFADQNVGMQTLRDQYVFTFNQEPSATATKEDLLKMFSSRLDELERKQKLLRVQEN